MKIEEYGNKKQFVHIDMSGAPDRQHVPDKVHLDESEQREVIAWFCRNRADVVCEIFCEDCPEVC